MKKPLPFKIRLILLLCLAVLCHLPAAFGQDTWERKGSFPGGARNMAVSFVIGKKAYVGLGVGDKNYKDLWEYDTATDKWAKKTNYPGNGSERAIAFTVNNKAYVGLGDTAAYRGREFFDDLYEYDPTTDKWTKKATFPGGGRAYSVGFGIGTKGYVGTGWNGNVTKDFFEYDPVVDKWTKKADFGGEARGFATGFALNGKGYIGTGNSLAGAQNVRLKDFWEYDPITNAWTQKADVGEEGVWDAVGFAIGSKGYIGSGTAYGTTSQFYEYDPSVNKWLARANYAGWKLNTGSVAYSVDGIGYTTTGQFFQDEVYAYTPCGDMNFDSEFQLTRDNYTILAEAKRVKGVSYVWDFGDGKIDTGTLVFHTYEKAANYKVKLSTSNTCYATTLSKDVAISGIKGILNNRGGNTGSFTATIVGVGLTKIYLKRGDDRIEGEGLRSQEDGSSIAVFDLNQRQIGDWDVVAEFSDGQSVTLKGGFVVEDGNAPKLSASLMGDHILRIGFKQIYTVTYSNSGNTDARFVPLSVSGLPMGSDIELIEPTFDVTTLTGFDGNKNLIKYLKRTITDSASKTCFRMFYLPIVPAHSSGTLNFIFNLPNDDKLLHTYPNIEVVIGKGIQPKVANPESVQGRMAVSKIDQGDINDFADCLASLSDLAGAALGEIAGVNDWVSCGTGVAGLIKSGMEEYLNRSKGISTPPLDAADYTVGTLSTYVSCGKAVVGTALAELRALQLAVDLMTGADLAIKGLNAFDKCKKALEKDDDDTMSPIIGNAVDPNALYGPGDSSDQHFTNKSKLDYTVSFENMPTANLNAQFVTVIDTLKPEYFDTKTFGFTSVRIANSMFRFNSPVKSFIHDFDFVAEHGVKARVVATFDETTGIAKWQFYTIDPITNQLTNNVLAGFLPPNKIAPNGEGFVSYTIEKSQGSGTGKVLKNKAFITFDFNPVIATNAWNNTIDMVAPTSKVNPLEALSADTTINLAWTGSDNLSGIRSYDLFVSVDEGDYVKLLYRTKKTSHIFIGKPGSKYSFFVISNDNANNFETQKATAEATVTIEQPDKFTLPANNFKLAILSAACKGQSNGAVSITAIEELPYTAVLTGANLTGDKIISFNKEGKFEGLAAGSYKICLTVLDKEYEQCFDVVVTEPKDLVVYTSVNKNNNTVELQLSGSTNYNISVNGKTYNSKTNRLSVPLNKGSNRISVSTDLICQGSVDEVINVSGNLVPYPNPVEDIMYINLGEDIVKMATLFIYSANTGNKAGSASFNNTSGVVQFNMSNYEPGIYSVHITINGSKSIYKIVKK